MNLFTVLLIGGIVGVAGQFKNWEFAAAAMYPLRHQNLGVLNKSEVHD